MCSKGTCLSCGSVFRQKRKKIFEDVIVFNSRHAASPHSNVRTFLNFQFWWIKQEDICLFLTKFDLFNCFIFLCLHSFLTNSASSSKLPLFVPFIWFSSCLLAGLLRMIDRSDWHKATDHPQQRPVATSAPLSSFHCDTLTNPEHWFVGCRIQLFPSGQLQKWPQLKAWGGRDPSGVRERARERGRQERRTWTETKDDCMKQNGPNQTQVSLSFFICFNALI